MSLRRLSLLLVPTCAAWLGCGDAVPPSEEVNPPEIATDPREGTAVIINEDMPPGCGEPDAGTGPVDTGTSVLVTADTRFHSAAGVTVVPQNLAGSDLEILVPNGVDFDRYTGTPVAGGMRFDNVPDGEYFLRSNRHYFLTRERHFDLGVNRIGRPDAVYVPVTGNPVSAELFNLDPWQNYTSISEPGTTVQLISADVNLYSTMFLEAQTGDTSIVEPDASASFSTGYGAPVLDASKGDRIYVNQLNSVQAGTLPSGGTLAYQSVVSSAHLPSFSFTPDGTTSLPLTATLAPVTQTPFSMEWRLSEFARWSSDANPSGILSNPSLSLVPAPFGYQHGWVGYQGELFNMWLPRGETGVIASRLAYGNPYPSNWGVVGTAGYAFRSATSVTVGSRIHYPSGNIFVTDRLDRLIAGPLQPSLSPPRDLRIDGVDAYVSRVVGSNQPVIDWRAPVMGTPRHYTVSVIQLIGTYTVANPTFRFYVPGDRTQVRLPPGLLLPGTTYYVRVAADGSPNYEPSRAPYVTAELLPTVTADTFSAVFTTP
ncbi:MULTISPECIES: fibronectin type III domain-containing protein [unclassified Corallococcus]|uniref:fibronectin type III domain-containing protein n=1 Tax=unclassified Corallococcus TaxID=2685029 RepID=UPI001A8DD49B|nr:MULTISPECIES: fibronectin type III domain-containing protein [unclassified Corallococcus]MBN9688525.1 fibronectin type III domain-containing protein [Corallococcus sp. NCSPR001]WAS87673.1 fibronectin type III domain-containing protein [Corallococcus sp. NCRR]